jgi:hypothetical protein
MYHDVDTNEEVSLGIGDVFSFEYYFFDDSPNTKYLMNKG